MEIFVLLLVGWLSIVSAFAISIALLVADLLVAVSALVTNLVLWRQEAVRGGRDETPAEPPRIFTGEPADLEPEPTPKVPARRRFTRRVALVSGGILLVVTLTIGLASTIFLEQTIRWLTAGIADRSGISLEFERARGNLLTGKVELVNVEVRRPGRKKSFEAKMELLAIDFDVWSAFGSAVEFESVHIDGVTGRYRSRPAERPLAIERDERREPEEAPDPPIVTIEMSHARFRAKDIRLTDIDLEVDVERPGSRYEGRLVVESYHLQELSANTWPIDLLIRANGAGTIDGEPFRITTSEATAGRTTDWEFQRLPVEALAALYGGPFSAFRDGTVEVHVHDEWRTEPALFVTSKWNLVFRDFRIQLPDEVPEPVRIALAPTLDHLQENSDELPITFELDINPETLGLTANEETTELGALIRDAAYEAIARHAGIDTREVREAAQDLFDAIREGLDRLRRP